MIVYLFNNKIITTINLPIKVNGMYPIYVDDKLIANVFSNNGQWIIQPSRNLLSEDLRTVNNQLIPYRVYNLYNNVGNQYYVLVATPKYESNVYQLDVFKQITIGNNPNCDVYYPYVNNNLEEIAKIMPTGEKGIWTIETNSNNYFLSGQRAVSGKKIMSGDYIFFYGLRVIFVSNIIIVNNPNGLLKLKSDNLRSHILESDFVMPTNYVSKNNDITVYNKEDYFFKSPRFNFIIEEETIDIDEPPEPVQEDDMPVILSIGPQLTMICTSILSLINFLGMYMQGTANPTRFYVSVGTVFVTIIGALLWPTLTRNFNKKRLKKREENRQKKYTEYLLKKKRKIDFIKEKQKSTIIQNHPSIEQCQKIIKEKTKELWQRNIDHDDFLSLRLGLGNVPTKLKINIPKEKFTLEDEDNLFIALQNIVDDSLIISGVPISYKFTEQSVNAIVGTPTLIKQFMDCVFLQMMTFHSYTDLKLVIFTKQPQNWEYLKVIPHCWDNQKTIRYFSTNVEELSIIAKDLEKTFDARVADSDEVKLEDNGSDSSPKKDYHDFRPYYLFFIDDMTAVRNVPLINKILHYKRNMGFSLVVTSDSISNLPSETSDFICITDTESAIMTSEISNNQKKFKADLNKFGAIDIYSYAQMLANIPITVEKEKYELPSSLSFLELYNLGRVEQLNSLARWNNNNPVLSLSVPIGIDQSGEVFKMDIHEKAYGPHGLVAGTTGSGKSEWIITYILSLAVNFSPNEVQFVLIDYKGGGLAMSFENSELGIKLPHLAGTITNLDKSEIFRSIAAMESELKRRQLIFNEAREKLKEGSMNIYKYQQLYRKGMVDKPLSHLLIICDEFAELKQQQPEFMDQLISISRIGRSLGIHLILATQKPSGVVNDQIWSNSKFKVCLKVQDKSDSNEILKKPDAAFLKQTGAFYLQVGNDDYYNLGQSAWAGAKYYPSDMTIHKIDESIEYIDNIGRTIGFYEEKIEEVRESKGEELLNIVSYISKISKETMLKSSSLWLENIKTNILISELHSKYNRSKPVPFKYSIAIGEYDEPREQKQDLLELDLQQGNIAIIGQNGSGIDNLLSTIVWASVIEHGPAEIAFYIIDFGTETLKKFAKFPQVGEVVFQSDIEKVGGVLDLVMEEIERRKEILSDYNGSFEYYNKVSDKKMPLIVTVINSFDVFIEINPRLDELMTNLFRDSVKYGVIFIISVGGTNSLRQRQLQYFNHTIVMQLNDDLQYRTITNCRKGLIPKRALGRGICKTGDGADSYCEFQTAFIADESTELEVIKNFATKCVEFYKTKVKQLVKIPDNVSSDDLTKYITTLADVPIGYNFYEKDIAKYNFLSEKIHLFTGKNVNENMSFVYALSTILSKVPNVKVRVVDMLELFKQPILDIKIFNDNINVVFAALEKDVLTRTEVQDYGVNIIIGAGQFKRKLSKGGIEIYKNLFNNLPNSKNNIFILIDNYENIRTLKLEEWFDAVNVNNGLWFGPGFSNQSLITSQKVSVEDKKYDYNGMAFNVNNGEYKLIKTAMDGDN